jgi:hypothetical protein
LKKFYRENDVYNESKLERIEQFTDSFMENYYHCMDGYNEKFQLLKISVPSDLLHVFERIQEVFAITPVSFLVDGLKKSRLLCDSDIEELLFLHTDFFQDLSRVGTGVLGSIQSIFENNLRYTPQNCLLKVCELFFYLNANPEFEDVFYGITTKFFKESLPKEFTPLSFISILEDKKGLEYFIKNKIYYRYFCSLNEAVIDGQTNVSAFNVSSFPEDRHIYISLIEFIFEKEKEFNLFVTDLLYEIAAFYERSYDFKLDSYAFDKLIQSKRSLHLDRLLLTWDYQDLVGESFSSCVISSNIEVHKYKNIYLYMFLSRLKICSVIDCSDLDQVIMVNRDFVVEYIFENPLHFPFLIKHISVKQIFLESSFNEFKEIDFARLINEDFSNSDKFLQILIYHFKKKNIKYISFLISMIPWLEKEPYFADLIDTALVFFSYSKSNVKKISSFFYMVYQEFRQLDVEDFNLNVGEFFKTEGQMVSLESFIQNYKSFYLKRGTYRIKYNGLQSLSEDQSSISSRVLTVLRSLSRDKDSGLYVNSLMDAFDARYNKVFTDYKFPEFYESLEFLKLNGVQASLDDFSVSVQSDFESLFFVGRFPYDTCFAYDQPLTNKFLVSYIVEPSVTCWYFYKLGKVVARRVMVQAKMHNQKVFLAMPVYTSYENISDLEYFEFLTEFLCLENNIPLIVYDQSSGCHPVMDKVYSGPSQKTEVTLDFIRTDSFKFDFLSNEAKVDYNSKSSSYTLNTEISGYLILDGS